MRNLTKASLILLAMSLCFVVGIFAFRNHLFPYVLLEALGSIFQVHDRIEIRSQSSALSTLVALPYVDGTFDPNFEDKGVLVNKPEQTSPGLTLFNSRSHNSASLIDMDGNVVYSWHYPSGTWQSVELLINGDLLVLVKDSLLMRIDKDSKLLWSHSDRFHHDVWVTENGDIHALARSAELVPEIHESIESLDERIVVLSSEGNKKEDFSVLDLVLNSPYAYLLPSVKDKTFASQLDIGSELDLIHTNHIEVLDGKLAHKSPLFREGNWLISMRHINTIAIVDGNTREIVWVWGPSNLTFQHQPTFLENGHILIFNNGTSTSEVLELDPMTREVVWRYAAKDFFSQTRGSVQRLPNGNTLITESDPGYVFEVTPEKEVVWRFANPEVNNKGERDPIWRMTRFQPDELPFLLDQKEDLPQSFP